MSALQDQYVIVAHGIIPRLCHDHAKLLGFILVATVSAILANDWLAIRRLQPGKHGHESLGCQLIPMIVRPWLYQDWVTSLGQ